MASLSGPVHVAFDSRNGLRSCDVPITGLNHTPHATAVYASSPASPQHSLPGCLLSITWVGLSPTDRASFAWRLRRAGPQAESRYGLIERLRLRWSWDARYARAVDRRRGRVRKKPPAPRDWAARLSSTRRQWRDASRLRQCRVRQPSDGSDAAIGG